MMPALKHKLPVDLLNYHDTASYEQVAPLVRDQLVATYSERDYDVSRHIATDESVKATYMGYLKYLSRDLRKSGESSGEASDSSGASAYSGSSDSDASTGSRKAFKRKVSKVSKQMIARGKVSLSPQTSFFVLFSHVDSATPLVCRSPSPTPSASPFMPQTPPPRYPFPLFPMSKIGRLPHGIPS